MIEEDQAICIPPSTAQLGVAIYGSLTGQPKAVQRRKDGPKPVVCCGCDAVNSSRVGNWLTISPTH